MASLTANAPSSQLPPVPRTITGLELAKLVRDPDIAPLVAVELAKGRLIVTPLTIHQALKATGADPFEFWRLYGLKKRPALKLGATDRATISFPKTGRRPRAPISLATD
jgi:hypothetical protein